MMEMTNGVIKSLIGCLDEMTKRNCKLPIKAWHTLSHNRSKLLALDKTTDEARIKLVEKYGTKDEESGATTVPQEKIPEFQVEYMELLEMKVDVNIRMIDISLLENGLDNMEGVSGIFNFFEYMVDGSKNE